MNLISKETLLTHLQRAEMADSVTLPIEFFRDLVYQAIPREWVGLTDNEIDQIDYSIHWKEAHMIVRSAEAKLKEKNA